MRKLLSVTPLNRFQNQDLQSYLSKVSQTVMENGFYLKQIESTTLLLVNIGSLTLMVKSKELVSRRLGNYRGFKKNT